MTHALDRLMQEVAMWSPHLDLIQVTRGNIETVDITEAQREQARELLKGCGAVIITRPKVGARYVAKFVDGAIVYWVEPK